MNLVIIGKQDSGKSHRIRRLLHEHPELFPECLRPVLISAPLPPLRPWQNYIYTQMMMGANCCLFGSVGVGKTYVVDRYIKDILPRTLILEEPGNISPDNISELENKIVILRSHKGIFSTELVEAWSRQKCQVIIEAVVPIKLSREIDWMIYREQDW